MGAHLGAHLGAHSARTCSRRLSPARLGTVLTWARTHSCRSPRSGNIPGGQGVAGSNPAVPTGQSLISNAATGPRVAAGSAPRSQQFDATAVVRRVRRHNATGQQEPDEPTHGVVHPGRTCLRVKRSPVHLRPSRLALGNTRREPRRDKAGRPGRRRPSAPLPPLRRAHGPPGARPLCGNRRQILRDAQHRPADWRLGLRWGRCEWPAFARRTPR